MELFKVMIPPQKYGVLHVTQVNVEELLGSTFKTRRVGSHQVCWRSGLENERAIRAASALIYWPYVASPLGPTIITGLSPLQVVTVIALLADA